MTERCSDCGHRWSEHAATHPDGCQHRYLNGEQCVCTEPNATPPA